MTNKWYIKFDNDSLYRKFVQDKKIDVSWEYICTVRKYRKYVVYNFIVPDMTFGIIIG